MKSPMTRKVIIALVIIAILLMISKIAKASDSYEYEQRSGLLNNNINIIGVGIRIDFIDLLRLFPDKFCIRLFSGYNEQGKLIDYSVCK